MDIRKVIGRSHNRVVGRFIFIEPVKARGQRTQFENRKVTQIVISAAHRKISVLSFLTLKIRSKLSVKENLCIRVLRIISTEAEACIGAAGLDDPAFRELHRKVAAVVGFQRIRAGRRGR